MAARAYRVLSIPRVAKGLVVETYYDVKLPEELQRGELSLMIGVNAEKMMNIARIQIDY